MHYFDNAATTKPLEEAIKYAETFLEDYYNPSAVYRAGLDVQHFLNETREFIVSRICPIGYECVFTSCGTEADNFAVFSSTKRGNIVTSSGEHSAINEPFKILKNKGVEVRYASLNKDGSVNVEDLISKIDNNTSFVSIVHVNNETGAVNDINSVARAVKRINPKVVFHSDGVQAFGKLPYRLTKDVDLYSISAHKIGGLKGAGALLKKKDIKLQPLIYGGGQEGGLRSGTENVFGIAVFRKATEIKYSKIADNYSKITKFKEMLVNSLCSDAILISTENCLPYIVTIALPGLKGEVVLHMLEDEGIIVGTGSACSSRNRHSRILKECGYPASILDGVIRISFNSDTNEEDVALLVSGLNSVIKRLKKIVG